MNNTVNINEIVGNMKKTISELEDALNSKEVKCVNIDHGFTPYFDRTHVDMWIDFKDGTQAILPIGWYQGEPDVSTTVNYARGNIVGIFEG